MYNFNTPKKYIEASLYIDLSAIEIVYENIDFLSKNCKFDKNRFAGAVVC